jgi:hypothetical protein
MHQWRELPSARAGFFGKRTDCGEVLEKHCVGKLADGICPFTFSGIGV